VIDDVGDIEPFIVVHAKKQKAKTSKQMLRYVFMTFVDFSKVVCWCENVYLKSFCM
jgi:hypothetical protein